MTDIYIKLDVYKTSPIKARGRESARVRIEAKNGVGLPNEIFLYKREIVDPITERAEDEFTQVSTLFYLATTPVNEPPANRNPPFFRKSYMDIIVPNAEAADTVADEIAAQVTRLINDAKRELRIAKEEPVWVGDVPDCPDGTICIGADDDLLITEDTDVSFLGQDGETATLHLNGTAFTIGNVDGAFVFGIDSDDEHTFEVVDETITVEVAGLAFDITWNGTGSLLFSVVVVSEGSL